MRRHVTAEVDEILEDRSRHLAVGHVDRGLDHGKDEAFPPEAVVLEIALLGLQQALRQAIGLDMVRQQRREALLGQLEHALGMPERVVSVECDGGKAAHARGLYRRAIKF
jgi:hypothetical protein